MSTLAAFATITSTERALPTRTHLDSLYMRSPEMNTSGGHT